MKKFFNLKSEKMIKIFIPLVISFLMLIFIIPRLPDKYFYDTNEIFKIMNGQLSFYTDGSYKFAAYFFKNINFLGLTTFIEWSTVLTLVGTAFYSYFLNKYEKIQLNSWMIILITILFANIYIFRVSKDFIQFCIWVIIFIILTSKINSIKKKNFLIISLLLLEGFFFRTYYYAIACIYLFFLIIYLNREKIDLKKNVKYILLLIFFGILFLNVFYPEIYYKLVTLRYSLNSFRQDSIDAVTIINDLFSNDNVLFFFLNYIINFARICFPIELITKGFKYIAFIFYQIYIIISVFKRVKNNFGKNNFVFNSMTLLFFVYLLVVTLYEPDFGSLIRHEVCLSFVYLGIILSNNKKIERKGKYGFNINSSSNI